MVAKFTERHFAGAVACLRAACRVGSADAAVVAEALARIPDGDANVWVEHWLDVADCARELAHTIDVRHGGRAAIWHYRRATTYYAAALDVVLHSDRADDEEAAWRRQHECWERIVDVTGERMTVPMDNHELPAAFFPASEPRGVGPAPVVIVCTGPATPMSQAWIHGGAAAASRGYHWVALDAVGAQAALPDQGILVRSDWEHVLTPVLEMVLARGDVDAQRVAVVGSGSGSYGVARALAFEHRFAAAAVSPGIVDLSTPWLAGLPGVARYSLDAGDNEAFDRQMGLAEMFTPFLTATIDRHGAPYGALRTSRFNLFTTIQRYRLGSEISQIRTPLFITDADNANWGGQSGQLAAQVGTAVRGNAQGVFRWLGDQLDARPTEVSRRAPRDADGLAATTVPHEPIRLPPTRSEANQ